MTADDLPAAWYDDGPVLETDEHGIYRTARIEETRSPLGNGFSAVYAERTAVADGTATYRVAMLEGSTDGGRVQGEGTVFDYEAEQTDHADQLIDEIQGAYLDGITNEVLGMMGALLGNDEVSDDLEETQIGYDTMQPFAVHSEDDLERVYDDFFPA